MLEATRRHINNLTFERYEEYIRAVYDSFSAIDDQSNFVDRFNNIKRLESVLISFLSASVLNRDSRRKDTWLTNIASFQHMTPNVSTDRWLQVLQQYLNISMDGKYPVIVRGRRYIQTVFALNKELGETDFAELYDWLCVQALIPFASGRIIAAERPGSAVLESHRALCFANSDRIFHYALQYPYLSDVVTTEVREDIGRLMQDVGLSLTHIFSRTKSPKLKINCTSDAVAWAAEAYTRLFRRSSPEHFEERYARYPDMKLSAVSNWISTASSTFALNDGLERLEIFADAILMGPSHAWSEPLEASYLDSPWYALSAPKAIKLAGIGSRLIGKLLSEFVLNRKVCKTPVLTETEDMWHCMAASLEDNLRDASAIMKGARAAMLSWAALWEAYRGRTQYRGNTTVLGDFSDLPEPALFFVFGCLWSCGEGIDVAEAYCNLPLRHDANFAKTFSCPRGSPMRPEVQCPSAFSTGAVDSL
ncbi:hypothetical protein V5799_019843 [Amblyomma americanum]|uniref:Uncharacterized protein n=1 Tax=Amblyomma americanum TaxID=6943 RepID=A0AAQ4EWG5_AMBAM